MKFNIRYYGEVEINDPLAQEIINTQEMQRIKDVNQHAIDYICPWMNISRFEHCLGVYCLLKKLGASKEEQIAGLIHDASHTVFSHVCDYVYKRYSEQDHHEEHHERILKNSKIISIIKKRNLNPDKIISDSNFPLLEKELPDLCADRIDYFLRDSHIWNVISFEEHQKILNNLTVFDNEIVFRNKELAKLAAEKYIKTNNSLWATPRFIGAYHLFSQTIRLALDCGILIKNDLFTQEKAVWEKLRNSNNKEILSNLELLNPKFQVNVVSKEENPDLCLVPKVRFIDPKKIFKDSLIRLSELDEEFKSEINNYIKEKNKGLCIKIIKP